MGTAQRDVSRKKEQLGGLGGSTFPAYIFSRCLSPPFERLEQAWVERKRESQRINGTRLVLRVTRPQGLLVL